MLDLLPCLCRLTWAACDLILLPCSALSYDQRLGHVGSLPYENDVHKYLHKQALQRPKRNTGVPSWTLADLPLSHLSARAIWPITLATVQGDVCDDMPSHANPAANPVTAPSTDPLCYVDLDIATRFAALPACGNDTACSTVLPLLSNGILYEVKRNYYRPSCPNTGGPVAYEE